MAKLNDIKLNIRANIDYGYMDDNWNWISISQRKDTTMKVTAALRASLITAAKADRETAYNTYLEAQRVLDWASALIVGGELTSPTTASRPTINISNTYPAPSPSNILARYFMPSTSGKTKGHYIVRFYNGNVECSCPGFVNRGVCWASRKVSNYPSSTPTWTGSKSLFDNNRQLAYNVSF